MWVGLNFLCPVMAESTLSPCDVPSEESDAPAAPAPKTSYSQLKFNVNLTGVYHFLTFFGKLKFVKRLRLISFAIASAIFGATVGAVWEAPLPSAQRGCAWWEPRCYDIDACTAQPADCVREGTVWTKTLAAYPNLYRCGDNRQEITCHRQVFYASGCPFPGTNDHHTSVTCEK